MIQKMSSVRTACCWSRHLTGSTPTSLSGTHSRVSAADASRRVGGVHANVVICRATRRATPVLRDSSNPPLRRRSDSSARGVPPGGYAGADGPAESVPHSPRTRCDCKRRKLGCCRWPDSNGAVASRCRRSGERTMTLSAPDIRPVPTRFPTNAAPDIIAEFGLAITTLPGSLCLRISRQPRHPRYSCWNARDGSTRWEAWVPLS